MLLQIPFRLTVTEALVSFPVHGLHSWEMADTFTCLPAEKKKANFYWEETLMII